MAKPTKVATVAEIADSFRTSSAAVITEYRGLTMSQLTTLRKNLGGDTAYTVAKNTLVKRAAADAGVEGLDQLFTGPTAVAFINGEPVDAAKVLRDFSRANPLLVIKGGLLDGKPLNAGEVTQLADLESREILLGKMAGAMLATLTKAAVVLNALPSQVARLAAALVEKRTENEGAPEATATEAHSETEAGPASEDAVAPDAPAASADSAAPAEPAAVPAEPAAEPAEAAVQTQAAAEPAESDAAAADLAAAPAEPVAEPAEAAVPAEPAEEVVPAEPVVADTVSDEA